MDTEQGTSSRPTEAYRVYDRSVKFWLLFVVSAMVGATGAGCFIVFCFAYSNYAAGMWALSAAVFSFAALHLHVLNLFNNLASWHDVQSLNQIKYLAIGVCVLSTIGAAVFGAMAFHMKDEIDFGGNNFIISALSAVVSLLAGLVLMLTAIRYAYIIQNGLDVRRYGPLAEDH